MELLFYVFIKPFILIFEAAFSIFGRLWDTVPVLTLTFLAGLIVYLPMYTGAKNLQCAISEGKTEQKNAKKYIKIIAGFVIPLFSQIMISFSVLNFVRENLYLEGVRLWFVSDLTKPDAVIGHAVNILPFFYLLIAVGLAFIPKRPLLFRIASLAESIVLTVIIYGMPAGVCYFWILFAVCRLVWETGLLVSGRISGQRKMKTSTSSQTEEKGSDADTENSSDEMQTKKKTSKDKSLKEIFSKEKPDYLLYFAGLAFLILLAGYYIPTNIIKISTQEFVDVTDMKNPMLYILYSMALAVGLFGLYGTAYYFFSSKPVKIILERLVWALACVASVDYLFSGAYQGEISSGLAYFDPREFTTLHIVLSVVVSLPVAVLSVILAEKKKDFAKLVFEAQLAVLVVSVIINTVKISGDYRKMSYVQDRKEEAQITLGKNGKNVVVLIMDRALGPVVPFLFDEKPELKEEFDGFVYYPNTISFGAYTNTGIPAAYGGYEYTPEMMNARSELSLADKHNEALKVLPVLFSQNHYDVTIIDPAYAGYNWVPDLSIFDEYPEMHAYRLEGTFKNQYPDDYIPEEEMLKRNFFFHAVMKMMPLNWQDLLYESGNYCDFNSNQCVTVSKYIANGYHINFLNDYYVLKNLPALTTIEDGDENHFVSLYNGTPHMDCLLQEPDYVPKRHVDNTAFHTEDVSEYRLGDRILNMYMPVQVEFYHVDMATFLVLGEWFEYLKENGCYDNTRIIIVADHGADAQHFDSVLENNMDVEAFMPMLLMKDFNAHGITESDERMTNADVPYLATKGIIDQAKNPFTGNLLDAHEKEEEEEFRVFYSENNTLSTNHGNVYKPDLWFSVKGDPYNLSNWEYLGKY